NELPIGRVGPIAVRRTTVEIARIEVGRLLAMLVSGGNAEVATRQVEQGTGRRQRIDRLRVDADRLGDCGDVIPCRLARLAGAEQVERCTGRAQGCGRRICVAWSAD